MTSTTSEIVQVFGRRHDEPFHRLWRPAPKKRQVGTERTSSSSSKSPAQGRAFFL